MPAPRLRSFLLAVCTPDASKPLEPVEWTTAAQAQGSASLRPQAPTTPLRRVIEIPNAYPIGPSAAAQAFFVRGRRRDVRRSAWPKR
jgi:hypothetical protein